MPFHPDQLLLYAVTDRAWTGRQTLLEQLEAALQGGVTLVQLREKDLDPAAFLAEALEVKALCRRYHVPLILNDQVDLALACGADLTVQSLHKTMPCLTQTALVPACGAYPPAGGPGLYHWGHGQNRPAGPGRPGRRGQLPGGGGRFPLPHQARRPAPYARGAGGHLRLGLHPRGGHRRHRPKQPGPVKGVRRGGHRRGLQPLWGRGYPGRRPGPGPPGPASFVPPSHSLVPPSQPAASVPPGFDLCTNAAKETPP